MIIILIPILVICGIIFYFMKKNDLLKSKEINILTLIILINIILILFLGFIPSLREINLWGICIFILIHILMLICSKKISKKRISLFIGIIFYFFVIFITPIYKCEDHEHIFNKSETHITTLNGTEIKMPSEEIKEYIIYYNCYDIKLLKKYYN